MKPRFCCIGMLALVLLHPVGSAVAQEVRLAIQEAGQVRRLSAEEVEALADSLPRYRFEEAPDRVGERAIVCGDQVPADGAVQDADSVAYFLAGSFSATQPVAIIEDVADRPRQRVPGSGSCLVGEITAPQERSWYLSTRWSGMIVVDGPGAEAPNLPSVPGESVVGRIVRLDAAQDCPRRMVVAIRPPPAHVANGQLAQFCLTDHTRITLHRGVREGREWSDPASPGDLRDGLWVAVEADMLLMSNPMKGMAESVRILVPIGQERP